MVAMYKLDTEVVTKFYASEISRLVELYFINQIIHSRFLRQKIAAVRQERISRYIFKSKITQTINSNFFENDVWKLREVLDFIFVNILSEQFSQNTKAQKDWFLA